MFTTLMVAAALTATPSDPSSDVLVKAIEQYQSVLSYQLTLHATHAGEVEHFRYYYKRHGFVRMEFIQPHSGAVLIYSPETQRVRLWPFGAGSFPELNLSPDNILIRSARGQQVDRSDIGVLFENIRVLQQGGATQVSDSENWQGHTIQQLLVTGADGITIAGVHRYALWLDMETGFPIKVISLDAQDELIETVLMEDLIINPNLPDALFNP